MLDLVVTQPLHIDFPIFRYNLQRFNKFFNKIYVCLSDGHVTWLPNLSTFLTDTYKQIATVTRPRHIGGDWRDNCVKELIEISAAPYILFIEQDFLIKDEQFFRQLLRIPHDFIYYEEGGRKHPACALVDKSLILKTSRNFSAQPPQYDHFGLFFDEIQHLSAISSSLQDLGFKERIDYYHLAGTTQNYYNYVHGEQFYKPAEFLAYNYYTNRLDIPKDPSFDTLSKQIEMKYGFGDKDGFIKEFV